MPAETLVTGIVHSVGGHTIDGGSTLVMILTPWLRGTAKPVDGTLRVQIPVAAREIDRARTAFESGATAQLTLEQLDGPTRGQWVGVGRLPLRRVGPNAALVAFRLAIERPATLDDSKLGRLTLKPGEIVAERNDQQMNDSYDGQVRLGGKPCALSIELTRGSRENTKAARARDRRDIAQAAALVARFDQGLAKILGGVAREVLATRDKDLPGVRPALTADALRQRLVPASLLVSGNGAARLILGAGDLFGGQSVLAFLDKAGALSKTWIAQWK